MPGKFEVYQDKNNEWRFRLKSPNGKIVAVGESYKSKQQCLKGVYSVIKNSSDSIIIILEN